MSIIFQYFRLLRSHIVQPHFSVHPCDDERRTTQQRIESQETKERRTAGDELLVGGVRDELGREYVTRVSRLHTRQKAIRNTAPYVLRGRQHLMHPMRYPHMGRRGTNDVRMR